MHASHADWLELVAKRLDCYWTGADKVAIKQVNVSISQNVVCANCQLPSYFYYYFYKEK